jgi:hypothetical protein
MGKLMLSKKLFLSSTLFLVLFCFPIINSVGASSLMWSQTYGGELADVAHSVVQTSDGGFAVAVIYKRILTNPVNGEMD